MANDMQFNPTQTKPSARNVASHSHVDGATQVPLVSVIIPCFNQADYVDEAITSVLNQTHHDLEIIVVDDGSTDSTPEVARRYPEVRYIKQKNRGLSQARNAGFAASRGRYLVFLDADDRLLPDALAAGIGCIEAHPNCAFVSGGHRRIDQFGKVIEEPTPPSVERDHYLTLLQDNYVGMHATVMYQRHLFEAVGGFNENLRACEDYDMYLRLARNHPVFCHDTVVADYRTYASSMSTNISTMLPAVVSVLRGQRVHLDNDPRLISAYHQGLRHWRTLYVQRLVEELSSRRIRGNVTNLLRCVATTARYAPSELSASVYHRWIRPAIPPFLLRTVARLRGESYYPALGSVRLGDLRRLEPISPWFGFERGLPIDRYYIERFLAEHADDVRGRVLEIGDSAYTRRFGGSAVTRIDVFHATEGAPGATFTGDLSTANHMPANSFDCAIVTQTLHLIYDVKSALRTLHRVLKPGGVLLLTVPGITQVATDQWGQSWYWSFTSSSIRRLLEEQFKSRNVNINAHGNVLVAVAFLQGLATSELRTEELEPRDPHYQLLVTARAQKSTEER